MDLVERYGPWAFIAGSSDGLGAAIADAYAASGVNVVLLARRADELEATARRLRESHGVETRTVIADLAAPDIWETVAGATMDLEIGMFVYNACEGFSVQFLDDEWEHHEAGLRVNGRTPALLTYHLGRMMRRRGRGSIVICGSMGGTGGQWGRAHYAAGKAYEWVLFEGLWAELKDDGVDVVAYMVGVTATPKALANLPAMADVETRRTMNVQTPEECAAHLVTVLDQGPVAFPSEWHEKIHYDSAGRPRRERVLATMTMVTAPTTAKR